MYADFVTLLAKRDQLLPREETSKTKQDQEPTKSDIVRDENMSLPPPDMNQRLRLSGKDLISRLSQGQSSRQSI